MVRAELQTGNEALRTEMATGFAEMRGYVFDWMKANMTSVTSRVGALETGHGTRLTTLEARVTKLEIDRN